MQEIQIPLEKIGRIRSRSTDEISGSMFTLGCEVLDRDFAFDEPVLADVISGNVYAIPADRVDRQGDFVRFHDMPVIDAPLLIAEKRLLYLE